MSFGPTRIPASTIDRRLKRATGYVALAAGLLLAGGTSLAAQTNDLVSTTAFRVCADPANTPFSDEAGTGFENKIAELLADELGLPVRYTWFPMATGFVRKTLKANACDVIIGYAQGHELVLNTNHYYTSAYVMLTPADSDLVDVDTTGDPALKGKKNRRCRRQPAGLAHGTQRVDDRGAPLPAVRGPPALFT